MKNMLSLKDKNKTETEKTDPQETSGPRPSRGAEVSWENKGEALQGLLRRFREMEADLVAIVGEPAPRGRKSKGSLHAAAPTVPVNIEKDKTRAMADRIEAALTTSPDGLDVDGIAKILGESPKKVSDSVDKLAADGHLVNVLGYGKNARYRWTTSDNYERTARREFIKRLLMESPKTTAEIATLTNANRKDIDNDIVEIRRAEPIWKFGQSKHKPLWFLHPSRQLPATPEEDGRLSKNDYQAKKERSK